MKKSFLFLLAFSAYFSSFSQLNGFANNIIDEGCVSSSSGSARVNATGGVPPYVFTISPIVAGTPAGASAMNYSSLLGGSYVATITDDIGDQKIVNFTINTLGNLNVVVGSWPDTCLVGSGTIYFNNTNAAQGPFDYEIDGAVTSSSFSNFSFANISAGFYDVKVTDVLGCSFVQNNLEVDTVMPTSGSYGATTGFITTTPAYCNDGTMNLTITSGFAPYTLTWNTGGTNYLMTNQSSGFHTALVVDSIGCTTYFTTIIDDSSSLTTCSTISGSVYWDNNGSCTNSGLYLSQTTLVANPGNYTTMADWPTGDYSFNLPYGSYTITEFITGNTVNNCVQSYAVTTSVSNPNQSGFDFGNEIIADYHPANYGSYIRSGYSSSLYFAILSSENNSGLADHYYVGDPNFIVTSTVPPFDSQNGDTLFWDNIVAPQGFNEEVYSIHGVTSLPAGNIIDACYGVFPSIGADFDPSNDHICEEIIINSSYDPNDKSVFPQGDIYLTDATMEYTIRFQNTGTDTAINIVVMDTLSYLLDPSTFEFIGATHSCIPEIINNNILKFSFLDIMLPDSNINELLSHGSFSFRINQNTNNQVGDVIENTVGIYFDFNPVVVTNTTSNEIVEDFTSVYEYSISDLEIYPNPASNSFTINFNSFSDKEIRIVDAQGREVYFSKSMNDKSLINSSNWQKGIYLIQVVSYDTTYVGKIVIK